VLATWLVPVLGTTCAASEGCKDKLLSSPSVVLLLEGVAVLLRMLFCARPEAELLLAADTLAVLFLLPLGPACAQARACAL
jgi:hypothetical protein